MCNTYYATMITQTRQKIDLRKENFYEYLEKENSRTNVTFCRKI